LQQLASFRFWTGALLALVLAASSTEIAAQDYNRRLSAYRERTASARQQLRGVSVYSYLQPLVVRPPEPLSVLDQGFDSRLGTDVVIHLFAIPTEATGGPWGNEFLPTVRAVDLTTVVSVVLGLLALLLTCDTVTSEREDGTLQAIFAQGVSRWPVLGGLLAGNLLAIALPLGLGLLVSLSICRLTVAVPFTVGEWLRIAGLAGAYLAYLCLMLLLGLLISVHVKNSHQALGSSVFVWLVLAILVPAVAAAAANDFVTTDDVRRATEAKSADLNARYEALLAAERRRSPLRAKVSGHTAISFTSGAHRAVRYRFGSAPYYDSLAEYYRFETAAGMEHAANLFALRRRYEARQETGERLETTLAVLSPAFLLDRLAGSFAGTSITASERFLTACRQYREDLLAYLMRRGALASWRWFTDDPPGDLRPWPRYLGLAPEAVAPEQASQLFGRMSEPAIEARVRRDRDAIERDPSRLLALADLPRFQYPGVDFVGALRDGAAAAAALLGLNGLAAAAVWVRFRRLPLG
ncbi:MAG TPA: ABC transporter permease subunit, partial [Thermoanaerobaculia bacterium]|nr:ABC transporter permease subunit [Thermoanaerobaculia bacterium]